MEENKLPDKIKLSDGRVAKKRDGVKVRDIAAATNQPKGKEYLVPFAITAAKITIDDKPVVLEDILDMTEDDLLTLTSMFVDEDESKNV